jgi:hypothetical protein
LVENTGITLPAVTESTVASSLALFKKRFAIAIYFLFANRASRIADSAQALRNETGNRAAVRTCVASQILECIVMDKACGLFVGSQHTALGHLLG